MTDDIKRKTLAFFLLAVIVTALLAAALPRLKLNPGLPLPGPQHRFETPFVEPTPLASLSFSTLFKAIMGIVLTLAVLYGGYRMIKGAPWKDLVRIFLSILAFTLPVMVALVILFALVNVRITRAPVEVNVPPPDLDIQGPPLGPLPPGLIWLVWIGLCVVIVLLGVWLVRWRIRRNRAGDPLGLEAERAVQALRTGLDFKSVIVRCYWQMSLALKKEQGIELEETMTVREFERLLEAKGIPHAPVHQLTQLFEAARYGHQLPTPSDEQKAFDCLNAIVQHAQAAKAALR